MLRGQYPCFSLQIVKFLNNLFHSGLLGSLCEHLSGTLLEESMHEALREVKGPYIAYTQKWFGAKSWK